MKRQPSTVILVAGYALVAGLWVYVDQKQIDFSTLAFELFHGTLGTLIFLAVTSAVGFFAQWWSLLGLAGPLIVLGWLQASGYRSPWQDGSAPFFTLRTLVVFVLLLMLFLIGIGFRKAVQRLKRPEQLRATTDDRI